MYKRFSDFYDQLVFDIDYEKYSKNIIDILKENSINEGNILEIGCGTGNLTEQLAKNDKYQILAFDNSMEMLNYSFVRLSEYENVNVVLQDMYKFNYSLYEFDAIISLLDVINYITSKEKLIDLFSKIYSGLSENGVFVFDLNSRYKLLEVLGNNHFVYERDNVFYTWENHVEEDLVYFDLNFFVKDKNGKYERIIEEQVERYYSIDEIVDVLKKVGFKSISYFDEDGGEYKECSTQRILFHAKK